MECKYYIASGHQYDVELFSALRELYNATVAAELTQRPVQKNKQTNAFYAIEKFLRMERY